MKKIIHNGTQAEYSASLFLGLVVFFATLWLPQQTITVGAQQNAEIQNKVESRDDDEILSINAQSSADAQRVAPSAKKKGKRIEKSIKYSSPSAQAASHTNSAPITITDCPSPCPVSGQAASLYPSPITVAGEVGVVQRVSVTLNGFSHGFPADVDMLLVSPSGRKSVIMSDFGAGSPGVSNINLTLDDYAPRPIPSTVTGNTGVPFTTGTYRPANSGTTDTFPAPAPAAPYVYTLSGFNGDTPNGTWSLYIIDDANLDDGSISGGWTISFDVRPPAPAVGDILVSEFRTRGVGTTPPGSDGSADEFIELYNNTNQSITIIDAIPGADPTSATGAGWRISAAQGAAETTFQVLPQTLSTAGPIAIPARGHFLITTQPTTPSPAGNTYSLAAYPSGNGITASGTNNIAINPASATIGFLPDDAGLAIFSTANALTANRLDSVGFSSVTNPDYKEGTGLAPATGITTPSQHSWVRKAAAGSPQDTNNNAADFDLVETTGAILDGVQSILGAPGPERGPTATSYTTSSAPIHNPNRAGFTTGLIDPTVAATASPNTVYDTTPVTNGPLGTLALRRTLTNSSGNPLYALRYRVTDISTLGNSSAANSAELRVLNSAPQTVTTAGGPVTSQALTLQMPPAQPNGGGLNSSLAQTAVTPPAPLADGATTAFQFTLGVQKLGFYRFVVSVEGLDRFVNGVSSTMVLDGCVGPNANPGDICYIAPTAGEVTVSGRAITSNGRGIRNVRIQLTDSDGNVRTAMTSPFGYYRFNDVQAGQSLILTAHGKRYSFSQPTQIVNALEDVEEVNFIAYPLVRGR